MHAGVGLWGCTYGYRLHYLRGAVDKDGNENAKVPARNEGKKSGG